MMTVTTTKGDIERDLLIATDIVFEEPGCRNIATEWRLKSDPDGEIVRRDAWVSILRGQAIASEQTEMA